MTWGQEWVCNFTQGRKPADIAVEQSTKFELIVNLKSQKTLNLTIPSELPDPS
jgi:putative ABC transport system substrate-binding protein